MKKKPIPADHPSASLRMKVLAILWMNVLLAASLSAQNPVPAPAQSKRILLMGGIVHTAAGKVITNSAIGFEGGKLKLVADITTIRIDRTKYDTVIDISGRHVYPGLIALNTVLGLREIEAVRATSDFNETGSLNPSARSLVAYNTDSKVTPTVRANGILLAQVVPQGGLLSGQSSVVELDAWNYEDAAYKTDIGLHLNWPSMRITRSKRAEADEKQQERTNQALRELRQLFTDAKAYASLEKPAETNLHFESMRGLFSGTKRLFVHCNYVREIIAAAGFCRELGISMVLVGGSDSWMVSGLLRENGIPVVITDVHRLPSREDEAIDMPYRLPLLLKQAGVKFGITSHGFWQMRNLPFQAGTAGGYGLDGEAILQSVTADAAAILGIDSTTGTLEPGKDATLVICEGDLFDMKSSGVVGAFIRGREISLDSVQEQLYQKYLKKYGLD